MGAVPSQQQPFGSRTAGAKLSCLHSGLGEAGIGVWGAGSCWRAQCGKMGGGGELKGFLEEPPKTPASRLPSVALQSGVLVQARTEPFEGSSILFLTEQFLTPDLWLRGAQMWVFTRIT